MDRGRVGGFRAVASVIVVGLMILGALVGISKQASPHARANLNQISGVDGEAYDINGNGKVVGILYYPGSTGAFLVNPEDVNLDGRQEWFWNRTGVLVNPSNDLMVNLGRLSPGRSAEADSINAYGEIAGSAVTSLGDYHAFLIDPIDSDFDGYDDTWFVDSPPTDGVNDMMTDLGTPASSSGVWVNSINLQRTIVGMAFHDTGDPALTRYEGAVWSPARGWQEVGTLGGRNSSATMVSDTEIVVGYADYSDGRPHAFVIEPVWDTLNGGWIWYQDTSPADEINDLMFDLGADPGLAGQSSWANSVNCAPTVVGTSSGAPVQQAIKWDKVGGVWTMTSLFQGEARAINELGTIAGVRLGKPMILDPVLGMHDLDTYSGKPWQINGVGQVAGYFDDGMFRHPAVWAPHLQPWAVFTHTPVSGLTVEFNASLSKAHDGTIVSYDWWFDDGATGSGVVIQHTYASAGVYDVSMNVTNDDGLWQNLTLTVNVELPNEPPVPNIVVTVTGLSIVANASGSSDDGAIISCLWNFGDGASSSEMVASHTYDAAGTYDIDLTLMDDDYALAYALYSVTVSAPNQPPVPAMNVTVHGLDVVSDASASYDPDGEIMECAWYFGDGGPWKSSIPDITGMTMTNTYATEGMYQITLAVCDNESLWSWLNQTVTVAALAPPVADFQADVTDMHVEFNATSLSFDPDGVIVSYRWIFDDGSPNETGSYVTHDYAAAGTYDVYLEITDNDGLTAYTEKPVTVPSSGDYVYTISGGVATITGYTGSGGAITIPSTLEGKPVVAIGTNAFYSLFTLSSVTIPDSVITIGPRAFYRCWYITSMTIGNGVTTIGDRAFLELHALTSVTIPSSVITIGELAFGSCSLTSVTIPSSVTSIGDWAFAGNQGLTSVTIPSTLTSIGMSPFESCYDLTAINVDGSNPNYASVDGVLYDKDIVTLIGYPGGRAGTFTLPESVTVIGGSAFSGAHLTSVTIGSGVTTIGMDAFGSCPLLTSITFYGLTAPVNVGSLWISNPNPTLQGHAYAASNFPAPGGYFYGLLMGAVIPVVAPVAGFSASPDHMSIVLDASSPNSYDPDGWIVSYEWDFGDYSTDSGWTVVHDYWVPGSYNVTLTVTDNDGLTNIATGVVTATEAPPPDINETIIELQAMILNATDPSGQPLDNQTMDNLLLMAELAFQVGVRKTSGSDQAVEVRKTSGANLLVVFNGMVETYTLAGKLSGYCGWNLTCQANFAISLAANQVRIAGVPNYEWYAGCAPTAAGMLMAYWDAHGFDGLVGGQPGLLMNPDVWNMIATKEHLDDYVPFDPNNVERHDDSLGDLIPDNSTKDPSLRHENNCLADFMHTSWYSEQVGYGITLLSRVCDGLVQYTAEAPSLTGTTGVSYVGYAKELTAQSFKWEDLRYQVDTAHPMLAAVDVNGDGGTDHMVTIVGYCQIGSARLFAFHSTWDNTVFWGTFEMMKKEVCFGVFSGFMYDIVDVSQIPT